ncbi:MAG: glycosyltransferase family 39 protein [Anaerolineae bacterium]
MPEKRVHPGSSPFPTWHRLAFWRQGLSPWLLVAILLLAFGLRLHRIGAQSLWNDEGTSIALAQRDLVTIARDAAQDIHPPLYYWLLSGWVELVGTSEAAVRSLSAGLGVLLVALVFALGHLLAGRRAGLVAAFLAAINPFQVYYAQEARMYMLLAVGAALAFYAALRWAAEASGRGDGRGAQRWGVLYVLAAAGGLYTHYAFPLVLLAVNLVIVVHIGLLWRTAPTVGRSNLLWWLAFQVGAGLLFLPWLPAAYRQLTTWPQPAATYSLVGALTQTSQLLTIGPAAASWSQTLLYSLPFLLLLRPTPRSPRLSRPVAYLAPVLWLVVPLALIFGLGLFKDAYLKFMLVTSPAFCLLAGRALVPFFHRPRWLKVTESTLYSLLAASLILASVVGLRGYYNDPAYARDDYRAIASYIEAIGRPGDAILLNAPGQQEVFDYYYDGPLPIHPLPKSRPLDPAATRESLQALAQPGGRIFAVLWATDESDPDRVIEGWLDTNTYKALDSWYGNVRLVMYAVPEQAPTSPQRPLDVVLGSDGEPPDRIALLGYSLLDERLAAGEIAQITLFWQVEETPAQRYKVFLHVLDAGNHILGQRDAEPGGGVQLTTLWEPGQTIVDNYGLPVHPATPPGTYRVEVGMYDPETNRRLKVVQGSDGEVQLGADRVWLSPLTVVHPASPFPVTALDVQHRADARFGQLDLLGYDVYRLGSAHQPEAALHPGEVLHVNLYWQAVGQPREDWGVVIDLVDSEGTARASIRGEPALDFPTSQWQPGDVWRGQFNLALPGDAPAGAYRLYIQPIPPVGTRPAPFRSEPIQVTR